MNFRITVWTTLHHLPQQHFMQLKVMGGMIPQADDAALCTWNQNFKYTVNEKNYPILCFFVFSRTSHAPWHPLTTLTHRHFFSIHANYFISSSWPTSLSHWQAQANYLPSLHHHFFQLSISTQSYISTPFFAPSQKSQLLRPLTSAYYVLSHPSSPITTQNQKPQQHSTPKKWDQLMSHDNSHTITTLISTQNHTTSYNTHRAKNPHSTLSLSSLSRALLFPTKQQQR